MSEDETQVDSRTVCEACGKYFMLHAADDLACPEGDGFSIDKSFIDKATVARVEAFRASYPAISAKLDPVAAFKERLRQKVEAELKDLELELQSATDFSAGQQKGRIASIGARIHFIQLIKETH